MYQEFNKIYDNPKAYNFDPEKKTKFLIKDERLKMKEVFILLMVICSGMTYIRYL